jgi:3-hydroxybutyryl-CoA dehydrogenase
MEIERVGVIGAGVMGTGLAQTLAQAKIAVILLDISEERLQQARGEIKKNIRLQKLLKQNAAAEKTTEVLERITASTDYRSLEAADFVIENVTEKWEIKQNVYQQIDRICRPDCILAANTSSIPITRLASVTRCPSRIIGLHFMNPVWLKPMVEVIRSYHTSEETMATAQQLLTRLGKEWIIVNDSPGFVSNRVLMLTINEAVFLLQDQVASVEDVDRLFRTCFGHKMGPLETADLIGLDTILFSIEVLYQSFNDSKYRPCPLLRKMVDAGLYGRKSGRGFYRYQSAQA